MLDKVKKHLWAVGLAVTTLSALVSALLTNQYIAEHLAPPEKVEGLPAPGSARRTGLPDSPVLPVASAPEGDAVPGAGTGLGASGPQADETLPLEPESGGMAQRPSAAVPQALADLCAYEPILTRNLFDSETTLQLCVSETDATGDSTEPQTPPLAIRLIGTALASPMQYSWALISKDENGAAEEVFSIGDDLYGQGRLIEVRFKQVVVERPDSTRQTVDLYTGQTTQVAAIVPASAPEPTSKGALGDTIRKVGENKYEIDAREVQDAMDNMDKLASSARIVPSYENGVPVGFKVFRIKPNSFYSKLGVRNGDVIKKINGFEINSPEKALQMYQILRTEKNLTVELSRRGQPISMDVSIR